MNWLASLFSMVLLKMFRQAVEIAAQYTRPVIISRKTVKGVCSSTMGAFIVVNDDGWIVTTHHILELLNKLTDEIQGVRDIETQRNAIEGDAKLSAIEKWWRLSKLKKPGENTTDQCSAWWSMDGVRATSSAGIQAADISVARLQPFDPAWVKTYPIFKDPSKNFEPGTSLCKLGFPFHNIQPTWNVQAQKFELPPGALPVPRFPIEGIFTRTIEMVVTGSPAPPIPLRLVETSSPGLRGQSGGPIFDVKATIWAVQSHTAHYPLDFTPPVPGGKSGETEHQFLNVGRGVHPDTIFGLLQDQGVKFQISNY